MAAIQLYDLRLSVIWAETHLNLLDWQPPPPQTPLAFLRTQALYTSTFQEIGQLAADTPTWTLPWRRYHEHFWQHYLNVNNLTRVAAADTWRGVTPLRMRLRPPIQAAWLPGHLTLEGFAYPHGLALVLTTTIRAAQDSSFGLFEAVDHAYQVMDTGRFVLAAPPAAAPAVSLDGLAAHCLDQLYTEAYGQQPTAERPPLSPFTVVTVIRGSAGEAEALKPATPEVHRALEALTRWPANYAQVNLQDFKKARIPIKDASASRALYGSQRGRAVWFADCFTEDPKTTHKLSCYHRNLVFSSLHVESLGRVIAAAAEQLDSQILPPVYINCVQRAAIGLGWLFTGKGGYRSCSAQRQIIQNGWFEPINQVREQLSVDMPKLKQENLC